jgi:splicing factor 3B subunit 3
VHQETYGKSGARRIVPGQYLAVDPKGRALMIAAVEKSKLVYVLNRDTAANLTISSPLEAHKSHVLCFGLCALDMGFENPVFAAIELDYGEADADATGNAALAASKHLTLYELDLGLNHVVRKWSEPCDNGANLLVAVPGGGEGPGGVLLCAENFVTYKAVGQPDRVCVIPRRSDLPGDRGVLITAATQHRTRDGFFFLLQSEYGDVYKATLAAVGERVSELKLRYFDTLPPATSLAVLRAGFLFSASEWGNHGFFQFTGVGEGGDDAEASSATLVETEEGFAPVFFDPRPLRNLLLLDDVLSLSPITALIPAPGAPAEAPALLAACGQGPRSKLALLRPGVAVTELAVSPLPAAPTAVWTVRRSAHDAHDAYIVVGFANATVVLAVGDAVEEVHDSGFRGTVSSLAVGLLADNSMVQVYPGGLIHIKPNKMVQEWRAPGRKTVARCAINNRQCVLALTGGELVYFELDAASGSLIDVEKRDLGSEVACLDIGPVPEGRLRSRFLAVGAYDSTVRILSLDPDDTLQVLALQALNVAPESLLLLDLAAGAEAGSAADAGSSDSLLLAVGLANGVLLRTEVDRVTGQLSDPRRRVLGHKPPKLAGITLRGRRAMLALSSRPWLGAGETGGRFALSPLSYDHLIAAAPFHSEAVGEGVVALARDATLRVFAIEAASGAAFNATTLPLRYTPRALAPHPTRALLAVVEADAGVLPPAPGATRDGPPPPPSADAPMGDADAEADAPAWSPAEQFGLARGAAGQWASCVRLVDTKALTTAALIELAPGEAAMCATCCQFPNYPDVLLAVGIAIGLQFNPRAAAGGAVALYRFPPEGGLELLHRTPLDDAPTAIAPFHGGRLLLAVGRSLRLYDLGKKKLLRKCEASDFPNALVTLSHAGDRIYAGDMQESVHFVRYKAEDNAFYTFADDTAPRWVTAAQQLDYDTVAGADKFGNLFVLRLPADASEEAEEDPAGGRVAASAGQLNGAPRKLEAPALIHVGAPCRALCRAALQPGGAESLLFGSLAGAVGALLPFSTREDVDFAQQLEMHMRQEAPPLSGRDHLAYRSSYAAVRDVVDGDLCEQFAALPPAIQRRVAEDMERSPAEVLKKLEDLRARIL